MTKGPGYLLTAAPADGGPELDASPEFVPLLQKAWELLPPALPKGPRENLVLALLVILLHGVGQVTAEQNVQTASQHWDQQQYSGLAARATSLTNHSLKRFSKMVTTS